VSDRKDLPEKSGIGERAILARFAATQDDAAGLLAFALHRRAVLDFHADFATRQGRGPEPGEEAAFLIGETSESRIAAYRAAAAAMIGGAGQSLPSKPAKRRSKLPWFGYWVESPLAPERPEEINWRGLVLRLAILLLAVMATAILLRILFVRV
jgi:hypothetical protein